MSMYASTLVAAYDDELTKIATRGLVNEPTVHKHNRKWAARLGGIAAAGAASRPLIEHYYARYRPHMGDTLRRAGKRGAIAGVATGALSLGVLEGLTALTKKKRDATRAMVEARQAAKQPKTRLADSPRFLKPPKVAGAVGQFVTKNKDHLIHGAELAGLGVLAKPSYDNLRNKNSTPKEKKHAKYELAGLGILGAPAAISLAHSAYKAVKPRLTRGLG